MTQDLCPSDDNGIELRGMIYGPSGAGKTCLACSLALRSDGEVLVVNFDDGLSGVPFAVKNVRPGVRNGKRTGGLTKDVELLVCALADKAPGYESVGAVVLDSVTELVALLLQDIVAEAVKVAAARGKHRNIDQIWKEDYAQLTVTVRRIIGLFRDLGVPLILTAHARRTENEDGTVTICPALPAGCSEVIRGMMNFVWLLHETSSASRRLVFQPRAGVVAKTRAPAEKPRQSAGVQYPYRSDYTLSDILAHAKEEAKDE